MSKTTPHFVTVPFVCLSLQFLEGSRPNQKFFEMIQDFRATLEITPLSTTETVGFRLFKTYNVPSRKFYCSTVISLHISCLF